MGLFSAFSNPRSVSPTEFHNKVRGALRVRGLSERDVDHVTQVVGLGLEESGTHRGLDRNEIDQAMKSLRENRESHSLSSRQIDTVEEVLKAYL